MNDTMTPCVDCGTPVPTEIHAEEFGFCLECSNQYWGHYGNYDPMWGPLGRPDKLRYTPDQLRESYEKKEGGA